MASQTLKDVKAIYAAAKAKLDSLPARRNHEVKELLMQWILAGFVFLMFVLAIFFMQMYFYREEARQAQQVTSEIRWQLEQQKLRLGNVKVSK